MVCLLALLNCSWNKFRYLQLNWSGIPSDTVEQQLNYLVWQTALLNWSCTACVPDVFHNVLFFSLQVCSGRMGGPVSYISVCTLKCSVQIWYRPPSHIWSYFMNSVSILSYHYLHVVFHVLSMESYMLQLLYMLIAKLSKSGFAGRYSALYPMLTFLQSTKKTSHSLLM